MKPRLYKLSESRKKELRAFSRGSALNVITLRIQKEGIASGYLGIRYSVNHAWNPERRNCESTPTLCPWTSRTRNPERRNCELTSTRYLIMALLESRKKELRGVDPSYWFINLLVRIQKEGIARMLAPQRGYTSLLRESRKKELRGKVIATTDTRAPRTTNPERRNCEELG